jgi:hypothetical protein
VLKNNIAVKRYVTLGDELPDGVEVIAGLLENEEVIKVSEGVSDGDEVTFEDNIAKGEGGR